MVGEWKKLSRDCDREKLDLEDKTSAYSTLKSERKLIAGEGKNKERRDAERERKEETRQGEGERKEEETRREEREREEEVKERVSLIERVEMPGRNRTTPLKADHCQPENKRLTSHHPSPIPTNSGRERSALKVSCVKTTTTPKSPSPHIMRTSDHSHSENKKFKKRTVQYVRFPGGRVEEVEQGL